MALVRCEACAKLSRKPYGQSVEPVGYPNGAVICGTAHCEHPGLVWLWGTELIDYRAHGLAVFAISKQAKVRVKPAALLPDS